MISPWHNLALRVSLCLLVAPLARADWQGWPIESNTTWYLAFTNRYIEQLYSGLVERCGAIGVATPTNIDTWTCYAGTNAAGSVLYTNIVQTNVYAPFVYTYTNAVTAETHSATGWPYIKQAWIAKWDQYFETAGRASGWVDRARFDAGSLLTGWFTNHTNSVQFPVLTYTSIFANAGAGYVTNNGANFTRRPLLPTNHLVMCSVQARGSNVWSFAKIDTSDSYRYDQTVFPEIELSTAYYNWPTQQFVITGQVWDVSSQTASNTSETVLFGGPATNYTLTKLWHNITNIAGTAGYIEPSSNTTWRVIYRKGYATYGAMPYRLYALDLNERRNVLSELTHTARIYDIWVNAADSPASTDWWYGASASPSAFVDHPEGAVTSAVARYAYRNAAISDDRYGDNAGSACWRDWENGNHTSHTYSVKLWGCTWSQWRVPQWVTNQVKEADLYALAKSFGSGGAQSDTSPPTVLFNGLDHTNLVYDVANYLGRQNITAATGLSANVYGVVLTDAWSIATIDTDIITNYLGSTTGTENAWHANGFTFTKTCVVYCHTNWYRFK